MKEVGSLPAEFNSKEACESAAKYMYKETNQVFDYLLCVKK